MSRLLKFLLAPMMFGVTGDDGGGAVADRGDDFTPTDAADTSAADAAAALETQRIADETAAAEAAEKAAAEAAAKEAEDKDEKDDKGDEDKEKKKDTRIPLARHKELLEKERQRAAALENELNKQRATREQTQVSAQIATAETQLDTLEETYTKQIADGELAKAQKTMKDIRVLERSIAETKTEIRLEARTAAAIEEIRYDTAVERLEEAFPQIRPDSDEYDVDTVKEMLEMSAAYQAGGMSRVAALQKAVGYILKPKTTAQKAATTVTPNVSTEDKSAAAAAARKEAAVKKNLEAQGKTPPDPSAVAKDSDKAGGGIVDAKAVMKMTQKDFASLDEAQLSKLRGDSL